ncbi:glycosyl transferase family 28 [Methylobacterium sp. J-030]|uniref:glycosyltransferase n=1 Tax=Methylobacterium sp. J-030 TaxID=2836627 RepID=UPI001FB86828|nr:glycosyltransferase [Methylobacterium sp. J-030]MCJ2073677.1 glycosyl transferase family 28 [Methylobacterium sp. J-030]
MRVLITVTHLLGAGHLTRAAALARTFAAAGHTVMLISGGVPSPLVRLDAVRVVQLPPLHIVGTAFSALLKPDGEPADAEWLARRRALMLDAFETFAPDAVLTELFPFGRRALGAEFLALVEAAHTAVPRPLILASVRDILVAPTRPERIALAHARVAAFYDAVLVHGDPALVPLEASWPLDTATARKLRYTGYVDEGMRPAPAAARAGVLAAAGSGPAGLLLLRAAADAARQRPDLDWRILAGHGVPEAALSEIGRGLAEGVLGRARADYRTLLADAALSVSQCGYNTATDILAAAVPAVLVPFEAGGETEQRLRAEHLAARGLARVLPEAALSAATLLRAVETQLAAAPPGFHGIDLGGAARTVEIVERLYADRSGGSRFAASALDPAQASPVKHAHDAGSDRDGTARDGRAWSDIGGATRLNPRVSGGWDEGRGETGFPRVQAQSLSDRPHHSPYPTRATERRSAPHPSAGSRWRSLRDALDATGQRSLTVRFFWRDDDAVTATPALDRLLALAQAHDAPLLLAAIPAGIDADLGRRLATTPEVNVAVHGLAHRNHAPSNAKPSEFGADRPLVQLIADAAAGLRIAQERLPDLRLLPIFVPPWNRLAAALAAALPALGYLGLSAVPGPPVPGLRRIDATLDPIDWRGSRSLRDPDAMLAALAEHVARMPERPIGLLTHHLVQDSSIWCFVEELLAVLLKHPAVEMLQPRHIVDSVAMDRGGTPLHHSGHQPTGTV